MPFSPVSISLQVGDEEFFFGKVNSFMLKLWYLSRNLMVYSTRFLLGIHRAVLDKYWAVRLTESTMVSMTHMLLELWKVLPASQWCQIKDPLDQIKFVALYTGEAQTITTGKSGSKGYHRLSDQILCKTQIIIWTQSIIRSLSITLLFGDYWLPWQKFTH